MRATTSTRLWRHSAIPSEPRPTGCALTPHCRRCVFNRQGRVGAFLRACYEKIAFFSRTVGDETPSQAQSSYAEFALAPRRSLLPCCFGDCTVHRSAARTHRKVLADHLDTTLVPGLRAHAGALGHRGFRPPMAVGARPARHRPQSTVTHTVAPPPRCVGALRRPSTSPCCVHGPRAPSPHPPAHALTSRPSIPRRPPRAPPPCRRSGRAARAAP